MHHDPEQVVRGSPLSASNNRSLLGNGRSAGANLLSNRGLVDWNQELRENLKEIRNLREYGAGERVRLRRC